MDTLFASFRPLIRLVVRRPAWILAIAVLISAVGIQQARNLRIDTDFSNLLPEEYPSVQALERLRTTVGGESDVAVGIVSPSFKANKAFADTLISHALELNGPGYDEPYLTRADFRREVDFLKDNALYFASNEELRTVEEFLDDQIEEAKREANPFFVELEEDGEDPGESLQAMYDRLVGSEYELSSDSTTLVVRFYPSEAQTNVGFIDDLYADLGELVEQLEPNSYHPEMEVTLAGRLLRQEAEVQAVTQDVYDSFSAGVLAVILVVVLYFLYKSYRAQRGGGGTGPNLLAELARAPVLALVIALPLFMSLTWTGGVAALTFGTLNLMTSTLGLILFGLGIDFGIHFYARYTEKRADGEEIVDAAEATFMSTGQAIATGAFTTAGALFVLTAADFKGFSEFGFLAGVGVLFALIAMTVVMPALLALLESTFLLDLGARTPRSEAQARSRFGFARLVVGTSIVAVIVAVVVLPRVSFEYDFGTLEPEYEAYEDRKDVIERAEQANQDNRRNPAYVLVDRAEEVPAVVQAVRKKMRDSSSTILAVESLQERFPLADTAQQRKLERIATIRDSLSQNKYLRRQESENLERLRRAAQTAAPIELEDVPEFLRTQFTTKDGELGRFVMIYPDGTLADGRRSIAFSNEIGTIATEDTTYHAASTSLVAADMLKLVQAEAPWMVAATFVLVALLMLLNFWSVRWAALALIPLGVGVLWMLGVMGLAGFKLNFYNMVVLPAILGIGNDAGVHMVHRYREEGRQSVRAVLRSTGEHVTMGTLTTAIGFSGLLLSFHPGLNSMGTLAVLGLGTTLVAAVVFLPALLQWLEDRDWVPEDVGTG